jgi:hypothetical protein
MKPHKPAIAERLKERRKAMQNETSKLIPKKAKALRNAKVVRGFKRQAK